MEVRTNATTAQPSIHNTLLLAALLLAAGTPHAMAGVTVKWLLPAGGSWFTPLNWDTQHPPGINDDAVVEPASPGTIDLDQDTTIHTLSTSPNCTLLLRGKQLLLQNMNLGHIGSLFGHSGKLIISSDGGAGSLALNDWRWSASVLISGGEILLASGPNLNGASIQFPGKFHNASSLAHIHGSGTLYESVENAALIESDSLGSVLQFEGKTSSPSDVMHRNTGTISANIGTLNINPSYLHQYGDAVLIAKNGGTFNLNGVAVTGGKIRSETGGKFGITGASLSGVNLISAQGLISFRSGRTDLNAGTILSGDNVRVFGNAVLRFTPNVTQNSTLTVITDTEPARILVDAGAALVGSGSVFLNAVETFESNAILQFNGGSTLAQTVRGAGTISGQGTITGEVRADLSGRKLSLLGTHNNQGVLKAIAGGTLFIDASVTQSGSGTIIADGGTVILDAPLVNGTVGSLNGGIFQVAQATWTNVHPIGPVNVTGTLQNQVSDLTNDTTISIQSGASIRFVQGGSLQGAGTILLVKNSSLNPKLEASSMVTNATSHTLKGTGYLQGNWSNQGIIKPGNLFGSIFVQGTLTLTPSSHVEIEIGDTTPNAYDVLGSREFLAGTIHLGGHLFLKVSWWDFTMTNTSLDVVIAASLQKKFATFSLSPFFATPPAGRAWRLYYQPTRVSVRVTCSSDLDGDFLVDDTDFSYFVNGYNLFDCDDPEMPQYCPADLNKDHVVDDADFQHFVTAYNKLLCF